MATVFCHWSVTAVRLRNYCVFALLTEKTAVHNLAKQRHLVVYCGIELWNCPIITVCLLKVFSKKTTDATNDVVVRVWVCVTTINVSNTSSQRFYSEQIKKKNGEKLSNICCFHERSHRYLHQSVRPIHINEAEVNASPCGRLRAHFTSVPSNTFIHFLSSLRLNIPLFIRVKFKLNGLCNAGVFILRNSHAVLKVIWHAGHVLMTRRHQRSCDLLQPTRCPGRGLPLTDITMIDPRLLCSERRSAFSLYNKVLWRFVRGVDFILFYSIFAVCVGGEQKEEAASVRPS